MKIQVGLSEASIKAAIKQVNAYSKSMDKKCDELCRRLAEIGVEAAIAHAPIGIGNLVSGIHLEKHGDKDYLVVSSGDKVGFIEFGTGVVGEGTYQGNLPDNYKYDQRWTPEAHDPNDPTLWYYYDERGKRHSTRGQKAKGYMAAASEEMRNKVLEVAKEVFK